MSWFHGGWSRGHRIWLGPFISHRHKENRRQQNGGKAVPNPIGLSVRNCRPGQRRESQNELYDAVVLSHRSTLLQMARVKSRGFSTISGGHAARQDHI